MVSGVEYKKIDDAGLHCVIDGEPMLLDVDTVIVCAGQESERNLYDELIATGVKPQLIGGAFEAGELDAKRAIKQATELAAVV
jgi:2,4-dienoyl-CoA reductase (NADPH2)